MSADEFGQRKIGAACLEVPQCDVECGDRLGRDAGTADRRARPEQRLINAVDVGGILSDRGIGYLGEMRELGPATGTLGVAETQAR